MISSVEQAEKWLKYACSRDTHERTSCIICFDQTKLISCDNQHKSNVVMGPCFLHMERIRHLCQIA